MCVDPWFEIGRKVNKIAIGYLVDKHGMEATRILSLLIHSVW